MMTPNSDNARGHFIDKGQIPKFRSLKGDSMAKRLSIINFKGGVGKTTFAFQFAAGLARFHKSRVLLMDMDHQSSLSIVALTAPIWQKLVATNKTVNEIFKPFIGQSSAFPDKSIIEKAAIKQAS